MLLKGHDLEENIVCLLGISQYLNVDNWYSNTTWQKTHNPESKEQGKTADLKYTAGIEARKQTMWKDENTIPVQTWGI